jgi:PPOX class probable FMN-dependent enzyme
MQIMTTQRFTNVITEESELRGIFGEVSERGAKKQIDRLDVHCRAIIEKCPFILLGTSDTEGRCDVSPKGDYPGFIRVLDDKTIAVPDLPGNNRLDTLGNMVKNPQVGLIFMILGMNDTLRINGKVQLVRDDELLESMAFEGKLPKLASSFMSKRCLPTAPRHSSAPNCGRMNTGSTEANCLHSARY